MDIKDLVRDTVKTLKPYTVENITCPVKMDANENPYSLPENLQIKITQQIKNLSFNRYPDPSNEDLRLKISQLLKINKEMIVIGNGSDELIQSIIIAFGGGQKKILTPVPTFAMYKIIATALGEVVCQIPLLEDFDLDDEEIIKQAQNNKGVLIFLAYPNNPTGNSFSKEKIEKIIERCRGLVVIDEAYFDFSKRTFLSYINNYKNLIILRTLSKIGLAALRVGILVANEEIVNEIQKVRLPFNVNSVSQIAAKFALENQEVFNKQIETINSEKKRLFQSLKEVEGITPFPSDANFILFRIDREADLIHQELINKGILIRNLNSPGLLKNCLRVTVGTPKENNLFLNELKRACRKE